MTGFDGDTDGSRVVDDPAYLRLQPVLPSCQNFGPSWPVHGEPVATWRLAAMMLALQDRGCQNINLVASVELSDDREMEPSPSAEASQRPKGSSASRDHEPVDGATPRLRLKVGHQRRACDQDPITLLRCRGWILGARCG